MRRGTPAVILAVAIASVLPLSGLVGTARASELRSVTSWIEVSSTRPAAGCSVDLSVEVRDGGNSVSSARIEAVLFSGSDVVSADDAVTDGDGVAYLSVDASAGTGDWIDLNVGGAYLTGFSLQAGRGSSCNDGSTSFTASGQISASSTAAISGDASSDGPAVDVGVPFYKQERNLSCEFASLYIATAAWGNGISEYAFDDVVGWSDNPHWGFRGDITGWWGNTDDYGVYAEPLSDALAQFGFKGTVFYGQGESSALTSQLDAGIPTVVWLSLWGDQSHAEESDGSSYLLVAGEHVMVAYGYDDGGVYLSDPGTGGSRFISWDTFMWMWNVLDGMSLAVSPA